MKLIVAFLYSKLKFCFFLWLVNASLLVFSQTKRLGSFSDFFVKQNELQLIEKSKVSINTAIQEELIYADSASELSTKSKFDLREAESYYMKGRLYLEQKKYLQALDNFQKSIEIYDEIEDHKLKINVTKGLGQVYYETGEFTKAIDENFKLLQYYESESKFVGIASAYNNIGIIFHRGELNYKKSLSYYNKALDALGNFSDSISSELRLRLYTNIGLSYFGMDEFKKAETFLLLSVEGNKKLKNNHI